MSSHASTVAHKTAAVSAQRAPVLLLATQVFSTNGGVQAYMRRLLEVFQSYTAGLSKGYGCVILAHKETALPELSDCVLYCSPSKAGYTVEAAKAAFQLRPGIVIAGHLGVAPVAMLLKRTGLVRSFAVILHGIEAWRRCDLTDRLAARNADSIIATTRYTASMFDQLNDVERSKTRVIPLALGCSDLPERRALNASQGFRMLTVGRLVRSDEYKGVDTLIKAVARLRERGEHVQLDVVGTGDDVPRLTEMSKSLGVSDVIHFLGSVPDNKLEHLYASCDAFAMPSRAEGFGIVFLEAMRHGKPCIGGHHGGTPEVIDHGVNGLLVEHGNIDQLADAISRLAGSPAFAASLGANAQRKVESRYLFTSFRSNWYSFLDSMRAR